MPEYTLSFPEAYLIDTASERIHVTQARLGREDDFIGGVHHFLIDSRKATPTKVKKLTASLDMTHNVYGRTRDERLREVEEIAEPEENSVPSVHRIAAGSERESATPSTTEVCALSNLAPAVGLEPIPPLLQNQTHPLHNLYIFMQNPHSRIA